MEAFTNQAFLAKRGKYARVGSFVGLAALLGGLFTVVNYPLISYALLFVGLISASIGSYLANRYVREPRADQILINALDGLDKRYALYSYYLPSEHVLFSHFGFTVIDARPQQGEISYANGRWHHKAGMRKLLQLFGEPSLGRPDKDLEREIQWVREWAQKISPDEEIPVNGVIVFTHPSVTLDIQGLEWPVLKVEDLPQWIKGAFQGRPPLSTSRRREIRSALDELVANA